MKALRNLLNKDLDDFHEPMTQANKFTKRTVATRESGRPCNSRIN